MYYDHKLLAYLSLVILTMSSQSLYGQVLLRYVEEGLESNTGLTLRQLQTAQQQQAAREARGSLLPSLSLSTDYTLSEGGRSVDLPIGSLLNPVYSNLNALNRQSTLEGPMYDTDLENASTTFLPNNFHDTKIAARVPLFDRSLYLNYRAQRKLSEMSEVEQQVYEQDLVRDIKVTYYRYLQSLALIDSYDETLELLKEMLAINKRLVRNHKATRNVIDDAKYHIKKAEREKALATRDQNRARSYFNFLLNRSLDTNIEIDTTILGEPATHLDADSLEAQALKKRKEIAQLHLALNAHEYRLGAVRGQYLPTLSVGGEAGFQGYHYRFDQDQQYWLVNFALQWPLFAGFRRAAAVQQQELQQQLLDHQYRELQNQIALEVQDAYYGWVAAQQALLSAQAEVESTASTFDIIRQRYRQRKASLLAYQRAETNYTNARTTLVIAKYEILIQRAELERAVAY